MQPADQNPADGVIEATIEFARLDVAQLANHLVLQFDGDFFFLHFCQVQPPLVDADEIRDKKAFNLKASPVASVVLPLAKMGQVLTLLNAQYAQVQMLIAKHKQLEIPSGTEKLP